MGLNPLLGLAETVRDAATTSDIAVIISIAIAFLADMGSLLTAL
jgi:hypothetical protein